MVLLLSHSRAVCVCAAILGLVLGFLNSQDFPMNLLWAILCGMFGCERTHPTELLLSSSGSLVPEPATET
uniref:Putative secreted protein n=1 Tax=Anopheles darlingi TaxID=43151 RepID=A0A2M4DR28_ANODA